VGGCDRVVTALFNGGDSGRLGVLKFLGDSLALNKFENCLGQSFLIDTTQSGGHDELPGSHVDSDAHC
jgi:hypothetical protein